MKENNQTFHREVIRRTTISFKRRLHHLLLSIPLTLLVAYLMNLAPWQMLLAAMLGVVVHGGLLFALRYWTHLDRTKRLF